MEHSSSGSRRDLVSETFAIGTRNAPSIELAGRELAGRRVAGDARAALLTLGEGVMLVHLRLGLDFEQNGHVHRDHESIGYILRGRIGMRIGTDHFELGPGDTWYHPKGVEHTTEVYEEAEILEFHAPLREDLRILFGT